MQSALDVILLSYTAKQERQYRVAQLFYKITWQHLQVNETGSKFLYDLYWDLRSQLSKYDVHTYFILAEFIFNDNIS